MSRRNVSARYGAKRRLVRRQLRRTLATKQSAAAQLILPTAAKRTCSAFRRIHFCACRTEQRSELLYLHLSAQALVLRDECARF